MAGEKKKARQNSNSRSISFFSVFRVFFVFVFVSKGLGIGGIAKEEEKVNDRREK